MLYAGCVAGIVAGAATVSPENGEAKQFAFAATALVIPALLGARLWFVLQHWELFRGHPGRIFRPLDSGAAKDGGLILSVAASVPLLAIGGLPFWWFWDTATITMLVASAITRVGCLMSGCCAGRATSSPFGVWLPNHRGEWRRRFPTPLFEAGLALCLLGGIVAGRAFPPGSGHVFASALAGYALGRPLIALTRETDDFTRMMRISVAVSSLLFMAAMAVLLGQ